MLFCVHFLIWKQKRMKKDETYLTAQLNYSAKFTLPKTTTNFISNKKKYVFLFFSSALIFTNQLIFSYTIIFAQNCTIIFSLTKFAIFIVKIWTYLYIYIYI